MPVVRLPRPLARWSARCDPCDSVHVRGICGDPDVRSSCLRVPGEGLSLARVIGRAHCRAHPGAAYLSVRISHHGDRRVIMPNDSAQCKPAHERFLLISRDG